MRNLLANSLKVCAFVLSILISAHAFAQTVQQSQLNCTPAQAHCTSKDLSVVDVFVDLPPCTPCTGTTVTAQLKMTINNGTKSQRAAFALWGTLSAGASINGIFGNIFVCVGAITVKSGEDIGFGPGNQTFTVGEITFNCNQSLTLTNNLMAWTDASGTTQERCNTFAAATTCAHIEPKCGEVPSIAIRQPLTASYTTTEGCTGASAGKIKITPIGGTANYTVVLKKNNVTAATKTGVTTSGWEFTGLAEGTDYSATITDATTPTACTYNLTPITLGSFFCCTAPVVSTNPTPTTVCANATASFTAASINGDPPPTVQWQVKPPAGSFTNLSNGGVYSNVTTTTLNISNVNGLNNYSYRAIFTTTDCTPATSNPATLTVTPTPTVDVGGAVASICQGGTTAGLGGGFGGSATGAIWSDGGAGGTFNPNATTLNATYTAAANAPTTVTLTLTTTGGPCGTTFASKNLTVKAQPGEFKIIVTVQPTICDPSATIAVCNPNPDFTYTVSLNGGAFGTPKTGSAVSFGFAAGSNPQIKADNLGCTAIADCGDVVTTCPEPPGGSNRTSPATQQEVAASSPTTVKAYPNPFSDRIKFLVKSSVAGNGSLEIYNMMGQKVKTVYTGYIAEGTQTFELSLSTQQVANLVYVLRVGDKKMTGKILQINK